MTWQFYIEQKENLKFKKHAVDPLLFLHVFHADEFTTGCPLFSNIDFPWLFHDQKMKTGTTDISK